MALLKKAKVKKEEVAKLMPKAYQALQEAKALKTLFSKALKSAA